jgi:pyruvate-ferredoxin/flavodoxin oxidoreductase
MKKPFATAKDSWIRETLGTMSIQEGDTLPVSKIPEDGTFPTATTQYEKRSVAERVPVWNPEVCIQCGICSVVCPHACIRMKNLSDADAAKAPKGFKTVAIKPKPVDGQKATLVIAAEDCYECGVCFNMCPMSNKGQENPALSWKHFSDDHEFHKEQV